MRHRLYQEQGNFSIDPAKGREEEIEIKSADEKIIVVIATRAKALRRCADTVSVDLSVMARFSFKTILPS